MHARALDVLHDARDEHVHAVRNGVHFELGSHEVFIAEHGVFENADQFEKIAAFLQTTAEMKKDDVIFTSEE